MAEINIEKKRGVSPLVWILLLLVLAAIGWFAYTTYMTPAATPAAAPAATTTLLLDPGASRINS